MNGFLLRILLLVTVFVSAAVMIGRERSKRYRSEFLGELESLLREGVLPAENVFVRHDLPAESAEVLACADELERRVDRLSTPSSPGFGGRMAAIEEQLDELLTLPQCAARLESGGLCPLSIRSKLGEPLRDALWAHAFQDAVERGDPTGAARRFARYLDLQYLTRACREAGYKWRLEETRQWLAAFAELLADLALDAETVSAAADHRLARAAAPDGYRESLVGEYGRNFQRNWLPSDRPDSDYERVWHQIGAFRAAHGSVAGPCLGTDAPQRRHGRLRLRFDHGPTHELLDMESEAHRARRALTLARVALALLVEKQRTGAFPRALSALAAQFPGGVPMDPCLQAPFRYVVTQAGVDLSLAPWPNPSDPTHEDANEWKIRWALRE